MSSLAMIEMGGILIVYVGKSCAWMRFVQKGDEASERDWLVRELRTHAQEYQLLVWREGRSVTLRGGFALGPYRPSTR